ncbi:hypothetical protein IC607_08615 [Cellulomonas sp. JH27-2]|uniref:hypothetical protein n=1 Tax=Cellulomonas sp. JH27-2 TaxID=2774139 RepID=UPI00177F2CFD|nr:hypothetical protein [Cellulomonas sp. JH27-2]MBD8059029.1 hypothetical protein [Cellulomonas sp. JH27-2]
MRDTRPIWPEHQVAAIDVLMHPRDGVPGLVDRTSKQRRKQVVLIAAHQQVGSPKRD